MITNKGAQQSEKININTICLSRLIGCRFLHVQSGMNRPIEGECRRMYKSVFGKVLYTTNLIFLFLSHSIFSRCFILKKMIECQFDLRAAEPKSRVHMLLAHLEVNLCYPGIAARPIHILLQLSLILGFVEVMQFNSLFITSSFLFCRKMQIA